MNQTCCHIVYVGLLPRGHACGRSANYEHEGKHYCKTHHPPTVKAKADIRTAKYNAESTKRVNTIIKAAMFDEVFGALKDCFNAAQHAGVMKADRTKVDAAKAIIEKVEAKQLFTKP